MLQPVRNAAGQHGSPSNLGCGGYLVRVIAGYSAAMRAETCSAARVKTRSLRHFFPSILQADDAVKYCAVGIRVFVIKGKVAFALELEAVF